MNISLFIRSIISWILIILLSIIFLPAGLLFLLPRKWLYESKTFYGICSLYYYLMSKCLLVPIKIIGKENLPKKQAIFVANHQSTMDIPLLGSLVSGFPHVWLAKAELMGTPILNIVMPRIAIPVDMRSPQRAMRSLKEAVEAVKGKRRHVMIFPEGGRYTDGDIHKFYSGFAMLAKQLDRPVVPVRILGVEKVYPPGSFWIHRHPITMIVGKPMRMEEGEGEDTFKKRVHQWFLDQKE